VIIEDDYDGEFRFDAQSAAVQRSPGQSSTPAASKSSRPLRPAGSSFRT
jgi:DNA-binding transcriptional MocR family regulator